MGDIDEVVARRVLRVGHHIGGVVNRADGNAEPGGAVVEVVALLPERPGVNVVCDLHQVVAAVGHVLPLVALAPRGVAHQFSKELEVVVVEGVEDHVAVAGPQTAHGGRAVRHPRPGGLVVAGAGEERRHQADHHVLDRDVDSSARAAAAAFVEQCRDRERGNQTAVVAGLVTAQGHRRTVDVARPGRHLVDESAAVGERQLSGRRGGPGAGQTVGRDRRHDQIGPRLDRRLPVGDQDRGVAEQRGEGLAVAVVVQVEDDPALAGVAVQEQRRGFRVAAGCSSRAVAGRRLDLDHVGAEVGEQLAAVRAGDAFGQLDDTEAGERRGGRRCFGFPVRHFSLYASRAERSHSWSSSSPK